MKNKETIEDCQQCGYYICKCETKLFEPKDNVEEKSELPINQKIKVEDWITEINKTYPQGGLEYKGKLVHTYVIDFIKKVRTQALEEVIDELLNHFNKLEESDVDTSMEKWKNYKFIRNNIIDVITNKLNK